jgi:apolipoprotein N-acyltransferase
MHTNVPQEERWATADQVRHFRHLADATVSAGEGPVDLVIWPEMSVPTFLDRDPDARSAIAALLPAGALLLAGGPRTEQAQTGRLFHNTAFLLGGDGTIRGQYDKVHLVPFGEYVPFGRLLPLHIIGDVHLGYTAGDDHTVFPVNPNLWVRPLICYEIGFTYLYSPTEDEPAPTLLVNISNDAWFGGSIGPAQHFALGRFRAIESGLPVARAVNGGISAVVDPYGRVLAKAEGDPVQGFDVAVPPPVSNQHNWIVWRHFLEGVLIILTFTVMVGSISSRWMWCR